MASAIRASKQLYKIYVGNLPWTVSHLELRKYFAEFGKVVSANVVFDKKTGLSRGYGFVKLADLSTLEKLENEQGHVIEGNYIKIQKS